VTAPLVTCIIPVYNGARYLGEAIASVMAQTHAPVQIVVADDGSTDETPAIARAFGPRVTWVRQPNTGPAAARNLGLAHARGSYVSFLDADDRWHADKLARQLARFDARPDLGLCFTLIRNYWSDEVPPERRAADPALTRPLPGYVCPTLLARRESVDRVGSFDPTLRHASEPDWILRAAADGLVIELLPEVLVDRRLHADNRSTRNASRALDEYARLLKLWLDRRRQGRVPLSHDFGAYGFAAAAPPADP
jgi:glycosyltransferase involved in cell wall biosynthesis